ncbi:MAG TPA: hypothetical protein G4O08_01105 [Anaerolineae bacterium]|nr:hypothetical protein [Anaerolineae bacterium]
MRTHPRTRPVLFAFVMLILLTTACASQPVLDTPGVGDTQVPIATPPEPTPFEATLNGMSMVIPEGWYAAEVSLERLEALIFVQQDPSMLAEFDDPDLAVPLDYAAGALIITPLPEGSDAETLRESMLGAIADLTADDLDAMLLPLDQAGLIDYIAVEGAQLLQADIDLLAGNQALMMEGMVTFIDELPPELHIQIWLTWWEDSFIAYYTLATEQAWEDAEAPLVAAHASVSIR